VQAKSSGLLLSIHFRSVQDYLFLLQAACCELHSAGNKALVFAAAAVSDYFIPHQRTVCRRAINSAARMRETDGWLIG
jgi:hypothetical protein